MIALQAHTLERPLELPTRAKELFLGLRNDLRRASDLGAVVDTPSDIYKRLLLLAEPPPQILADLRERRLHDRAFCILGGEKNQQREDGVPHFRRSDGAWFDFSIVVRERDRGRPIELLAFDFEIRFPPGMGGAPFLRFDLNLPGHANDDRDLRCHLHPGSDDLLVPAPLMTPSELLALFIDRMQPPAERARRTITAFEARWFEHAHVRSQR